MNDQTTKPATTESRVRSCIAQMSRVDDVLEKIPATARLRDHGFDSLDLVECVMAVEDEFNIEIEDEDAREMQTISQITEHVERHLSGKSA